MSHKIKVNHLVCIILNYRQIVPCRCLSIIHFVCYIVMSKCVSHESQDDHFASLHKAGTRLGHAGVRQALESLAR